jgi:hypothetical protein
MADSYHIVKYKGAKQRSDVSGEEPAVVVTLTVHSSELILTDEEITIIRSHRENALKQVCKTCAYVVFYTKYA